MEVQLTDFENAAFTVGGPLHPPPPPPRTRACARRCSCVGTLRCVLSLVSHGGALAAQVFITLVSRVLLSFDLNLCASQPSPSLPIPLPLPLDMRAGRQRAPRRRCRNASALRCSAWPVPMRRCGHSVGTFRSRNSTPTWSVRMRATLCSRRRAPAPLVSAACACALGVRMRVRLRARALLRARSCARLRRVRVRTSRACVRACAEVLVPRAPRAAEPGRVRAPHGRRHVLGTLPTPRVLKYRWGAVECL
jgi:hypothetical protein